MIVCKKCKSADVIVAFWANPNTKEVDWDMPAFDYNEAPNNVCVQYCNNCEDEAKLEDATRVDILTRRTEDQSWKLTEENVLLNEETILSKLRSFFRNGVDVKVVSRDT